MKRIALTIGVALTLIGGFAALALVPNGPLGVSGSTATHILYVDGTPYNHTQESGPVIHWETGPVDAESDVTFPERNQTWEGNGSDNLPCEFGVHWISNENLLTLSHCLDGPDETTSTTSTTVAETTTTVAQSTTTVPQSTTTAPPPPPPGATTTVKPTVTPATTAKPTVVVATTAKPVVTAAPAAPALPETE